MITRHGTINKDNIALLDSASTVSVFKDQTYFEFQTQNELWQSCDILTIAGMQTLVFREGRATIVLPGGAPLTCDWAMYAPGVPRSLISYRDLRANHIHTSTAVECGEEILQLMRGTTILATAKAGITALYEIQSKELTPPIRVQGRGNLPMRGPFWALALPNRVRKRTPLSLSDRAYPVKVPPHPS